MDEKKQVIKAFGEVTGRTPANLNAILKILAHPDIITQARAYLQANDTTDACQKYQPPWNCLMESEANAQNFSPGWAREIHEVMENWCVNCRDRLIGEDPGDIVIMDEDWLETDDLPGGKNDVGDNPWRCSGLDFDADCGA